MKNICIYRYVVIILSIFLILMFFLLLMFLIQQITKNKNTELIENFTPNNKTCIIFKTHKWDEHIEKFAQKIRTETSKHNIDFYILMQKTDENLISKVTDKTLIKDIIVFTKSEINSMYTKGFYSMWLSNHWILMWFYKYHNYYDYYWSVEYDVRIVGDSSKIWSYTGTEDFIYPIVPFKNPDWIWRNHYTGDEIHEIDKWYGYVQLVRYSKKFLDYLHSHYSNGINGQDEMITYTLFKRGVNEIGLTGSGNLLNKLIRDSWHVYNTESDKNKERMAQEEKIYQTDPSHLVIFHPVKF